MKLVHKSAATAAVAGMMLAGGMAAPAYADHTTQDGLVNVVIQDSLNDVVSVEVEDVNIGVAAQVAANICGVKVGPVAVLGTAVDRSGADETVCTTDQGDVTLTQN